MNIGTVEALLVARDQFSATFKNAANALNQSAGSMQRVSSMSGNAVAAVMRLAGSYLSLKSAVTVVKSLADAQMNLERVQARFRVAGGGSQEQAAALYAKVSTEAKRLGLDLDSLADGYSKLAVATRGTALEGEASWQVFLGVAEASAAMGLSAEQASGALTAIEQMISKGTVSAEELRGQLGERLAGAFNMAAKAMGVTTEQLGKMLQKGEVTAAQLLPKLGEEMRKAFGSEAESNVNRLSGATNNLSTAWTELKNAVMQSGGSDYMVKSVQAATRFINALTSALPEVQIAFQEFFAGIARGTADFLQTAKTAMVGFANQAISVLDAVTLTSDATIARMRTAVASGSGVVDEAIQGLRTTAVGFDAMTEEVFDRWLKGAPQVAEAIGGGGKSGGGSISEAVQSLTDKLREQAMVQQFLALQLGKGGVGFEAAERRARAFEQVLSAGLDPTEGMGKALYEVALRGLEFAHSLDLERDRLQDLVELAEAATENFFELADARKEAAEATAADKARRTLQGFIDIGDLKQELEWEQRRLVAIRESKDALIEWAVAKAKADYVAKNNATPEMAAEFESLTRQLLKTQAQIENVGKTWEEINKGFYREVGRSLHSAAVGFLEEMESGLVSRLPKGVQSFAKALLSAANEWLVQMLLNIAKAKLAAKGIGSAGGGGGNGAGGMMGGLAKLFGGGGGAGGGAGAAGGAVMGAAAFFAVAFAAGALMKREQDRAEKRKFSTMAQVRTNNGMVSGTWGGVLNETGPAVLQAMQDLTRALQEGTGTILTGTQNAIVAIRRDKKAFEAKLNGELLGTFATAEEAILAVVREQFLRQEDLDPILRQVVAGFRGGDSEGLLKNVETVKNVLREINGLTDIEVGLQSLPGQIASLAESLKQMGISAGEASRLSAQFGVARFRDVWNQISGHEPSRAEQMKIKERERALLLTQMNLERARLLVEIETTKQRARVMQAGQQHQAALLAGRIHLVKWEATALRNGLDVYGTYVENRAQLTEVEANVYAESLAAMEAALKDLDQLIGEVSTGKIRLGGGGSGASMPEAIKEFGGHVKSFGNSVRDSIENVRKLQARLVLGEASPYTGRQRVEIARAEAERLMAMYESGGKSRRKAIEEIGSGGQIEEFLDLFKSTYGSTGAYAGEFERIDGFLSQVLREHGVAPVANIAQASADAAAFAAKFKYDSRGRLETRDEQTEAALEVVAQRGAETRNNTARVADLLELLLEQGFQGGGGRAAANVPSGPAPSSMQRGGRIAGGRG